MKFKIRDKKYYNLPFKTKEDLFNWLKTDIKVCPYCEKIDVSIEHVENCCYENRAIREMNDDLLYK